MKNEKKFDAVKMMREIRDKLSKEFVNMSYDEQKRYIKEKLNPTLMSKQPKEKS
jgi:hypothetical protein